MEENKCNLIMDDAIVSATSYLLTAKLKIDECFGDGYAAEHPELVGAYMNVCAKEYQAGILHNNNLKLIKCLQQGIDQVASSITILTDKINR